MFHIAGCARRLENSHDGLPCLHLLDVVDAGAAHRGLGPGDPNLDGLPAAGGPSGRRPAAGASATTRHLNEFEFGNGEFVRRRMIADFDQLRNIVRET
jgi:hypothetical protein